MCIRDSYRAHLHPGVQQSGGADDLLHDVVQMCIRDRKVAGQIGRKARLADAVQSCPMTDVETAGAYLLERYAGETHEIVYELCLDRKGKLLACKRLNDGGASSAALDIRKVVATALLTSASTVILAHNHPSGIALPSDDDLSLIHI